MISLKPKLIVRYADLAGLLFKYGRGDLAQAAKLPQSLQDQGATFTTDESEDATPEEFAKDLESRGPTFIKLGQLLSTRPDLLPQPYLEALGRLQDNVKTVPFDDIRQTITEDLGVRLSRGFGSFDEQPLAAASLGQVHRATMRDGREVVVKVQRPGVRQQITEDLEALTELAEFLQANTAFGKSMGVADIIGTLHDTIYAELDYRLEADNARLLRRNLHEFELFRVPAVIDDYVSSRVITMEYIAGKKITDVNPGVLIELDRDALAQEIFRVYLHQVLVDGVFHADPHPGNLLLTKERQIALMDFGMVTRMAPRMQQRLLKMLMAISDGLGEEAAHIAIQMGRRTEEFKESEFIAAIATLVAKHNDKVVQRLEAGRIMMDIQCAAGKFGLRAPQEMTMLGKTLLNLDQVIATLSPDFNPNEALRNSAAELLQRQTSKRVSLTSAYQSLIEATEFAQNLPSRANRLAESLANNEFKIHVDAIDEKRLMAGMQKIANRITTGLVLAALIVGASLLMQSGSTWTFVMATVFFLFAAISGVILVWQAMFGDEPAKPRDR